MNSSVDVLLVQYREYQRLLGSGCSGVERAAVLDCMRGILESFKEFPLPFCVGDRVILKSNMMVGTVIFVDNECVVVRYDNGITFEAYNAFQARTRLFLV